MLVRFATIRPRTEKEIKNWLTRKKIEEPKAEQLFNQLKGLDLVDDRTFIRWWIEQRVTFRPKSRRVLLIELLRHGVEREMAKEILESVDLPDEEELARTVIERKQKSLARFPRAERAKKITNILAARGFSWQTIKSVLK